MALNGLYNAEVPVRNCSLTLYCGVNILVFFIKEVLKLFYTGDDNDTIPIYKYTDQLISHHKDCRHNVKSE